MPAGKAIPRLISKRDVAHAHQQTDKQPPPREQNTRHEATNRSDATVLYKQTSSVKEQIAPPQPVGRKEKACKRRKKHSLHAEVPVQRDKLNLDSPHMMQHDPEFTDEEP